MQTHEIIFNLNKALQFEYSDVFLYPREAKLIEENDAVVASTFEEFALMEIRHADLLARRIIQLGGKPVWDFYLLSDRNELKDILARHIDYETRAVDFYDRLVEQVDDETKILLRGIKAEEQTHLDKIRKLSV
jgi:bacterioferritin